MYIAHSRAWWASWLGIIAFSKASLTSRTILTVFQYLLNGFQTSQSLYPKGINITSWGSGEEENTHIIRSWDSPRARGSRAGKGNSIGEAGEETRANKDVEDAGWWSGSMGRNRRKKQGLAVVRGWYKQEPGLSCIHIAMSSSAFGSSRIMFTDWKVCVEGLHKQFQPPEIKSSAGDSTRTAVSSLKKKKKTQNRNHKLDHSLSPLMETSFTAD